MDPRGAYGKASMPMPGMPMSSMQMPGMMPPMPMQHGTAEDYKQSAQSMLPFAQENGRGGPDLRDYANHPAMAGAFGGFGGAPNPAQEAVADQQQREKAAELARSLQTRFRQEVEKTEAKLRKEYLGIAAAIGVVLLFILWRSHTGAAKVTV